MGKESSCSVRTMFDPWLGKIPWRGKWQPTPVSLPGKSHGQRSLAGFSPRDHEELDVTEHACTQGCMSAVPPVQALVSREVVRGTQSERILSKKGRDLQTVCWEAWRLRGRVSGHPRVVLKG